MKKYDFIITFLLVVAATYWGLEETMPRYTPDATLPQTEFSTDRALTHVLNISKNPHGVGFEAHKEVRDYIITELERMGLETQIQEGYTAGDWGNFSKAINIMSRIEGSTEGKALLLLTHYDSSPHSSLGASDAGSGVATILEGVRAFLSKNKTPANDIIVLFTDAEELGLNGADIFVNEHPWAKDVGLALNFEARGSGGPSYMLIETNRGNARLIEEFTEANPKYPVANSLAYSIYKMLPNDTDLTVFREDGDIEGFNFAFIDDHYDYHTQIDSFERLDHRSLAHQASYLMPLLEHFSEADLGDLKSLNDHIFYNLPLYRLVSYPYDWIWPLFIIAVIGFIILLIYGFNKTALTVAGIARGFIPAFLVLIINGVIGFYGWTIILELYPQYQDILHGYTYNGRNYIGAFTLLSLTICFFLYQKFSKFETSDLMVAPILIWLLICGALGYYLKGASFLIVPVLALLASFMIVLHQKKPSLYLLFFLTVPALWLVAPFIRMFPVALGLKMIITSTLLATLLFFLVLGLVSFYKKKSRWALLGLVLCISLFISTHYTSGFNKKNPKPTSLLYVLDGDKQSAQWATYEKVPSDWTLQYLGDERKKPQETSTQTISSKYSTGFSFVSDAPLKMIEPLLIETSIDTIVDGNRILEICIRPQRRVNRLEVFTNDIGLNSAEVNGIPLDSFYLANRRRGKLINHYVSNDDFTELKLSYPADSILELTLYEASNDLLSHPQFSIPRRPENTIPMPFVLNDAILVIKTLRFE